jgi:hypothetical protein
LYILVDIELLEAADDDPKLQFASMIGFGMVYSMELAERLADYRAETPLMKDSKYKMICVLTLTTSDQPRYGLHFAVTIFVLEWAAHSLKSRCNPLFFTKPGVHVTAELFNQIYSDFVKQNPSTVSDVYTLVLDALRGKRYIDKVCLIFEVVNLLSS